MKLFKFLIISLVLLFSIKVYAANLSINPISQNVNVGDTVSVSIIVSTSNQAINAVSGVLSFPKDLLEVTSVSKTGSIINFWANDPKFSNSEGTVNFEGVIMSPGYVGSNGRVLKINFKVKSTGQANIQFDTASILANDGNGTDIISGKNINTESTSNSFPGISINLVLIILGIFVLILFIIIIYQNFRIKRLRILLKHNENKKKI